MANTFVSGLINEDRESLSSQLGLWHHLTLRNILQRKLTGYFFNRDDLSDFLNTKFQSTAKLDTMQLRTWKLNEILLFFKIPITEQFDADTLNAIGTEIEFQSVVLFKKVDKEFHGTSPDDMVKHLLKKILKNFSESFHRKDHKTQKQIIERIIEILQSIPMDEQDELKELLGIMEFSPDMIRSAIYDHSLSMALVSLMTMGRYTIYFAIAKIAVAFSGAASFYFARPLVQSLLPAILLLLSPVAVGSIGVGLTWLTDAYTNKQIKSFLLPVMVMSSILASSQNTLLSVDKDIDCFTSFYNQHYLHRPE